MFYKELLSESAQVSTELFSSNGMVEGSEVKQYGLEVALTCEGTVVSNCRVPDISPDHDFVRVLAERIVHERIVPSRVRDVIEMELSK